MNADFCIWAGYVIINNNVYNVDLFWFFMERVSGENLICCFNDVELTNKSVIKKSYFYFGGSKYNEIPIKNITSFSRDTVYFRFFLFLATLSFIFGFILFTLGGASMMLFSSGGIFGNGSVVFFSLGVVFLLLFVFTSKKEVVIRSGEFKISEVARGSGDFVFKLRQLMYC